MNKVFITAAKRTPIGRFHGNLSSASAVELASVVIKNILEETHLDPAKIDEVIVGNVLSAGQKQGVARHAAINAGIPAEVPAYGINMICGSGMKSVINAWSSIALGLENMVLAGGTESMSNAGFILPGYIRRGNKMGDMIALDHAVCDGLTDAFKSYHMGITAENIAEKYNISREEQDEFAYQSQLKAAAAVDANRFLEEIVPVPFEDRTGQHTVSTDEHINRQSSLEKLAKLRPAFKKDGTVTAGNASGINDGASFTLLASEKAIQENALKALCEVVAVGQGGVDPAIMGMGPVPAIADALKKAGLKLEDMDTIELNEAFASQSIAVLTQLSQDHGMKKEDIMSRCNPNGGAIALGHPIGASGNRIIVSLIYEMRRRNLTYGLASLCIGGGMGTAVILKTVK